MDPSPIQIREANRSDLSRLLALYQHLVPDDAVPSRDVASSIFDRFLGYEGSAIFVGETCGHFVASCTLVVVPNLTRGGSPYGLIENVVTHGDYRKRGCGKCILDHATTAAWNAGCYKVMLMTGSKRPETFKFYLAAGFEQSKTGFQKRRIPVRPEGS
ncbi:GNAT family N-acetyltransferase [Szabonella alba]|uniref:GNAT family N-acetyltransferase n=1 Tax=Szabonella alba TaxID=2804194 RepID=A0A8K0Y0K0_9RHOB|nr:GNAT family N-acetyltransferase [Szabonella alba]MBL4917926.1 GNAT family N-acetyltransferase [Szabonella alba]